MLLLYFRSAFEQTRDALSLLVPLDVSQMIILVTDVAVQGGIGKVNANFPILLLNAVILAKYLDTSNVLT